MTEPYDSILDSLLQDPERRAKYLEEARRDPDPRILEIAERNIARVVGNQESANS